LFIQKFLIVLVHFSCPQFGLIKKLVLMRNAQEAAVVSLSIAEQKFGSPIGALITAIAWCGSPMTRCTTTVRPSVGCLGVRCELDALIGKISTKTNVKKQTEPTGKFIYKSTAATLRESTNMKKIGKSKALVRAQCRCWLRCVQDNDRNQVGQLRCRAGLTWFTACAAAPAASPRWPRSAALESSRMALWTNNRLCSAPKGMPSSSVSTLILPMRAEGPPLFYGRRA
jgi:hypothetical protein